MFVCVGGRGGETDERRELSWNGAICHIGMALELHGGPPHSRRVFRSQSWEQGGAWSSGVAERGSEVTAYSSPGSVSVSRADGPAERERKRKKEREAGGQEGGGRKVWFLPRLRFPLHAYKICRRD